MILERSGFAVLEATNGEEGIRRAREDDPDAILMDIPILKIDGWQAIRILKADERTKRIPIIALTAHAPVSDRTRAGEADCDSYLAKPVEPRRVEEVRRYLVDAGPSSV